MNKKKTLIGRDLNIVTNVGNVKRLDDERFIIDNRIDEYMRVSNIANQSVNIRFDYPEAGSKNKDIFIKGISDNVITHTYNYHSDFVADIDNIKAKYGLDWSSLGINIEQGWNISDKLSASLPRDLVKLPKCLYGGFRGPTMAKSTIGMFFSLESITEVNEDIFLSPYHNDRIHKFDFTGMFRNSGLKSIPQNFLINSTYDYFKDYIELNSTFSAINITNIPKKLFQFPSDRKITEIRIDSTFSHTYKLKTIETGLFDNQYFVALFHNADNSRFGGMFYYSGIETLPNDLFRGMKYDSDHMSTNVFMNMFRKSNIREVSKELLLNIPYKDLKCVNMFRECEQLTHIPEIWNDSNWTSRNLEVNGMFYGCVNADNYDQVPAIYKEEYNGN